MADKKNAPLLAAYLVDGEDRLKRERVVSRMRMRLEQEGDLAFNSDTFDGATSTGDEIANACRTLPFASEKRLVVVNLPEKLNKQSQAQLTEYIKNPSETTVLLLVSDKLAKNTALYKAVKATGQTAVIDCSPPAKRDLPAMVRDMAPSHGITLTPGAAQALVELVGEDTVRIDTELEKLALAHKDSSVIEDSQVRTLVARTADIKPWEFVDAFSARRLGECIRLLGLMQDVKPHALFYQCVNRIRELICTQSMMEAGSNAKAAVASELKVPDWRVKNHIQWARGFAPAELRRALKSSLQAEKKMKSGSDPKAAFLDWVISVIRS